MTAFVDSSALVKLYVPEAGHEVVSALGVSLVVSHLARVEVPAAFWRKQRTGEVSAEDAAVLAAGFEADFFGDDGERPRFVVVAITNDVVDSAARLAARHGLRAYDAVQLASASAARRADNRVSTLAAFDRTLRAAAAAEGFTLAPPTLEV